MKKILLILLLFPVCGWGQIVTTVAGTGEIGYSGDGGPALNAKLNGPIGLKSDGHGNIFFADSHNSVVRKIDKFGIITTVVGTGVVGYSGDGGPAINATLNEPTDLVFDTLGNMYVADGETNVIRKINTSGIITTFAGIGLPGYSGDGGPATIAKLSDPFGLVFDKHGNLIFSDGENHRIRQINSAGIIVTIAGTGVLGTSGDGGPATAATFGIPCYLTINKQGEILVPDWYHNRVRKIDTFGIISTFLGNGIAMNTGDGMPATAASIRAPETILLDDFGNLVVSSYFGYTIRKINSAGIINTIAGNGISGYSGDGGPAILAQFKQEALCTYIDPSGSLYITDRENNRIRKITYNSSVQNNYSISSVIFYPTPTHNELTIESPQSGQVALYNMPGQMMLQQRISSGQNKIDISRLPGGVSVARVMMEEGSVVVRRVMME